MDADESDAVESRDRIDVLDTSQGLYGLMAEFGDAHELLHAAETAHAAGYRRMDGYSPLPVEGLTEAIGFRTTRLPLLVLIGAVIGGADRLRLPILGLGRPLPVERWWPAVSQLAGVYPDHVRNDDPRRVVYRGPGHAHTQRPPNAVSSSLQFA